MNDTKRSWSRSQSPGVGTYDIERSLAKVKSRNPVWSISHARVVKFTDIKAKTQQGFPGTGQYKIEKCYKKIY